MRNLKKFLALVLAMVMAFSLMLSASAADVKYDDYKDKDSVTSEFVEAVSVLTGLKVVQGDGEEGNKNFRPKDNITRAEAAAMVYRIATGDVAGTQERLYSDYGKFTDVNSGDWFAGYVGYCQNAGIIKGTSPTTFNPYGKVTGYEVLAMILRAVGYGQNNEFTGPTWQVNVASMGKTKHITDSVVSDHFAYTLNMPATREIVAELLFRGSLIPQVTWTQIGGYNENSTLLGTGSRNAYLSEEVFGLSADPNDYTGAGWGFDTWGRPQFVWKADRNPSTVRTVATLKAQPKESFHDEKRECDIAELMEFGTAASNDYVLFVNGKTAVTSKYHVVATDTVTRVGGYGRQVEIFTLEDIDSQFPWHNTLDYYNNAEDEFTRLGGDIVVMVDTYLAKVVNKTEAVKDPAGHVITPARLIVDLYDANNTVPFDKAASANVPNRRTISKPATSDASWEFAIGDVISLNGLSSNTAVGGSGDERWAYTLPQVAVPSTNILTENTNVFSLTKLDGVQAKQTTIYWNNGKHQVGGEDKTDALALRMDKAGTNIDTTFTWYYDQYGYLLGIDDGGKVNYGVITSIYVSYGTNEAVDTNGVGKAIATVKYADGTTGTETIDYFLVSGVNANNSNRAANVYDEMDETDTTTGNVVQLWPVYNVGSIEPMDANNQKMPFESTAPNPKLGVSQGAVYLAPVAASNAQAAAGKPTGLNLHGILNHNLFKFVKSAGDKTVAVEVAGGGQTYTGPSINVGSNVAGHWAVRAATNAATAGKVYKNLAYIAHTAGTTTATNANVVAWLDNDSQIMIRDKDTGSIACYDGVSALPGNVTIDTTDDNHNYNEIDWADTDGDGRADVVYLTGKVEGVTSYGLFYTNDQSAQWNGTTATISGFLNGEQTTLTFTSLDEFNKIKNNSYAGHLYAVKKVGDVVTDVMVDNNGAILLPNDADIVTTFGTGKSGATPTFAGIQTSGGDQFQYGTTTGYIGTNPYTSTTEAVYFRDYRTPADNQWRLTYNPSYNWSQLGADVIAERYDSATSTYDETRRFHLTPNTKVYGLGSNVVLAEGATALEYLNHSNINWNDVTIVYENAYGVGATAVFSVLELYIQTDPNWTPGTVVTATVPSGDTLATISSPASDTALGLAIKALGNNKVAYCADTAADYATQLVPDSDAPEQLYFPFQLTPALAASGGSTAYLTIYKDGVPVFAESSGGAVSDTNGHYFMINFRNAAKNTNANVSLKTTLTRGDYTFAIVAGGTTISSGSFTIV